VIRPHLKGMDHILDESRDLRITMAETRKESIGPRQTRPDPLEHLPVRSIVPPILAAGEDELLGLLVDAPMELEKQRLASVLLPERIGVDGGEIRVRGDHTRTDPVQFVPGDLEQAVVVGRDINVLIEGREQVVRKRRRRSAADRITQCLVEAGHESGRKEGLKSIYGNFVVLQLQAVERLQ
jgi:hypothetical protein